MEFKPIETQEAFDAAIADRIERAQKKAVEPYADYEQIKAQNADYQKQIAEMQETANNNNTKVADLEAKIKKYENDSAKRKIATEMGLPLQLADRLTGDDEAAWKKDAEALKALLKQPEPPVGAAERIQTNSDPTAAAWKAMAQKFNKE